MLNSRPGELDPHDGEQNRAGRGGDDREIDERVIDLPDPGELGDLLAQDPEQRKEGHEGHHRSHERDTEPLDDAGKAHRVFLDALGGAFDMA